MTAPLLDGALEPPLRFRWPRPGWNAVLRNDPCPYCPQQPAGTIDHIVPRAHGGRDVINNTVGACPADNGAKQDYSLLLYLLERIRGYELEAS
ncbi:MAG: endonuclease [Solirubrobacteraceae bacterium]|jgi:5-methylcytosine-specific restriction endonuclease McrA|nr:endonuclease [Solirubrobacteraceae bacterium]MEA2281152.1 endonuclease [Solirubrobacteraceae bacterium]